MKIHASRFNKIALFGTYNSGIENSNNGQRIPEFKEKFKLKCAPFRRTMNQYFQIEGTKLEDTIVIAVRHNKKIINDKSIVVKYNGDEYKIIDINPDEGEKVIRYDLITLKKRND